MPDTPLHLLDIMVIILPLVLVVLAYWRGIVLEVMLLVAWAAAIVATKWAFPYTQPVLLGVFKNAILTDFIAIAVVAFPIVHLVRLGGGSVTAEINSSLIGPMNRGLGVALGLVRGVMIAWLLVGLLSWSFFRSAAAAIYNQKSVNTSALIADLPVQDVLCGTAKRPSGALVSKLRQREQSLSMVARELLLLNNNPEQFPVLQVARTLSISLCRGKTQR